MNTIKARILTGFITLSLIVCILSIVSYQYLRQVEGINAIRSNLFEVQQMSQGLIHFQLTYLQQKQDAFSDSVTFHASSVLVSEKYRITEELNEQLTVMRQMPYLEEFVMNGQLQRLGLQFDSLDRVITSLDFSEKPQAMAAVEETFSGIKNQLLLWNLSAENRQLELITQQKWIYGGTVTLCIVMSFLLSFFIAGAIARPIRRLSKQVKEINPEEDRDIALEYTPATTPEEVQEFARAFTLMLRKLKHQLSISKERTIALHMQNEELASLNQELDLFMYSVSHDFKAPLSSVLGLIHVLKMEKNPMNLEQGLDLIERSVLKLRHLIHDLQEMAQIGEAQLALEEVNFYDLIVEIFEDLKFQENAELIKKVIKIGHKQEFKTDRRRVYIILSNLISNAIKYSNVAQVTPLIEIQIEINDHKVNIHIQDNGIGIEDKDLQKIFHMFYRATDQQEGTGLGLYIVKESVRKLQGKIEVTSEMGKGTSFSITIPEIEAKTEGKLMMAI
ncbi:HAMP domain-containing sensor histidine kinase [Rapidithrix thailandica]|uniref:histidine kinase n=1 Tax=Rapidithrix thailandica TaxID=413964 RepID=A0AAW9SH53_9BACT